MSTKTRTYRYRCVNFSTNLASVRREFVLVALDRHSYRLFFLFFIFACIRQHSIGDFCLCLFAFDQNIKYCYVVITQLFLCNMLLVVSRCYIIYYIHNVYQWKSVQVCLLIFSCRKKLKIARSILRFSSKSMTVVVRFLPSTHFKQVNI